MGKKVLIFILLFINAFAISEYEKIQFLLKEIEFSELIFIRNGVEYNSKKAREHWENKLIHAGDKIKTAEDFIKYIASRSSLSGKPYLIKFPDGNIISSEDWLRQKLHGIVK